MNRTEEITKKMVEYNEKPQCHALIFNQDINRCEWVSFFSFHQSTRTLREHCRKMVRKGEWSGYRFVKAEEEFIGATWQKHSP